MRITPVPLLLAIAALFAACSAPTARAQEECHMVVEAYSGKVLVAANSGARMPIGSLTMIATCTVACDWASAMSMNPTDVRITVPDTAPLVGGPNPMDLRPGDQMNLRDAMCAALLNSDNIAALAIADHVGRELNASRGRGGDPVAAFVNEMNLLARKLALSNTRFANPHGIQRKGAKMYSCAADVAKLSIYAMRRNALNYIARQASRTIKVSGRSHTLRNTNALVSRANIIGVKSGQSPIGGCASICSDLKPLVRTKPDGSKGATPRRLITVCLGSADALGRASSLTTQGWRAYDSWLDAGAPVKDRRREILAIPHN